MVNCAGATPAHNSAKHICFFEQCDFCATLIFGKSMKEESTPINMPLSAHLSASRPAADTLMRVRLLTLHATSKTTPHPRWGCYALPMCGRFTQHLSWSEHNRLADPIGQAFKS